MEHLQLQASQIIQESQHHTHPLHYITPQQTTPRRKKQTTYNNTDYNTNIDANPNTIDAAKIRTNMKRIHTTIVNIKHQQPTTQQCHKHHTTHSTSLRNNTPPSNPSYPGPTQNKQMSPTTLIFKQNRRSQTPIATTPSL